MAARNSGAGVYKYVWYPKVTSMARSSYFRSILLTVGFGSTALSCLMLGCRRAVQACATATSTSVQELLASLPNIGMYEIQTCCYTSHRATASSVTPSPSDTTLELVGYATLSDVGARLLGSQNTWRAMERRDLVTTLEAILPAGKVQESADLNRSFQGNATFVNGKLVVVDDRWDRIYFIARDIDHPFR